MVESSESDRSERLRTEVETLRRQLTEFQIQRMQNKIATLRNQLAEVQSLRQAEAGVIEYLRNQTEAVDRDCIYGVRRGLLLKALGRLVQDGRVTRTGTGQRGDRYRYQVAERANGGTKPVDDRTETPEPQETEEFRFRYSHAAAPVSKLKMYREKGGDPNTSHDS